MKMYPIQGMLFGIEWDWDNEWFSINLLIIKIVVNYNNNKWDDFYDDSAF